MIIDGTLPPSIDAIVHMGACSATTEQDMDYLMENNYRYTRILAEWCLEHKKRFIYASSAATYGNGEHGFSDNHDLLQQLKPTNRYGYSKHLFDLYALKQGYLNSIVGLKFFNVFGPNEYHKGSMMSMICKGYDEIKSTGKIKLFKSHKKDYEDGCQERDFVYVKDCVDIMWWLLNEEKVNGIFNIGTGKARSWNDVAKALFKSMDVKESIEYFDMPESIRAHYQYHTEAVMSKLKAFKCPVHMTNLENAVSDYVSYLKENAYF